MISEGNEIDPPKNGLIQYRRSRYVPNLLQVLALR
jgi:hypothetical protein